MYNVIHLYNQFISIHGYCLRQWAKNTGIEFELLPFLVEFHEYEQIVFISINRTAELSDQIINNAYDSPSFHPYFPLVV